MIKQIKLIVLLGTSAALFGMQRAEAPRYPDLKIINNSDKPLQVRLTTYQGIRKQRTQTGTQMAGDLLFAMIFPPAALIERTQKAYFGEKHIVTLNPHATLVIQDLLPDEAVEVGGTLLWKTIPLNDTRRLISDAYTKREKERSEARKKELAAGSGSLHVAPYPIKNIAIIVVTPTTTGFNFQTSHREERTDRPRSGSVEQDPEIEKLELKQIKEDIQRIK